MTTSERTAIEAGFHIIVPVWGESYTQLFAELCLPTLLAPGNIPALPHLERHVFAIYTTPDDRRLIEAAPAFAQLARSVKVEFYSVRTRIDHIITPYNVMSDCFRRAIRRADAADHAMVFLTPDLVMADGSLRELARIASTPVRAVLGVGIRLDKALVRDHLLAGHRSESGDAITIAPRDMTRLALNALHPIARAHMFHAESDELVLSNLYWRIGSEGLLARCFHLHPFLVYPRVKNAPFVKSVDGDYVEAACPDLADAYIITDSDEFSAWELSDVGRLIPMMQRSQPQADWIEWIRDKTTPRHRALVGSTIRIHCGMVDEMLWQRTEREAGKVVAELLSNAEQDAKQHPVAAARSATGLRFMTSIQDAREAQTFLDIALPSALAFGNIPVLPSRSSSRYTIALPAACVKLIESSPVFAELRGLIQTDLHVVANPVAIHPGFAAACRAEALRDAALNDAAAIFIDPDVVLAATSLDSAWRATRSGIRALVAPRLPLLAETAVPPLLRDFTIEGVLSIPSEELVRLAMEHLHPALASQLPGEKTDFIDPGAVAWPVENEGFVMHAFTFDPVLVYPRSPPTAGHFDALLLGAGLQEKEIGLFNESGPFVQCHLTARAASAPWIRRGDLAAWAAARTTPLQRAIFRYRTRFSALRMRGPSWNAVEAMAAAGALQLLAEIKPAARSGSES